MIPPFVIAKLEAFEPKFSPRVFKAVLVTIVASAFAIPLAVVALPFLWFLNDMAVQPKGKAQSLHGLAMGEARIVDRRPPEGSLPMSFVPYAIAGEGEEAAKLAGETLENPLTPTLEVLELGRKSYTQVCRTCHGDEGDGDGGIVGPDLFPAPSSLQSDLVREFPDGRIFHVIARGQNKMPAHAAHLTPEERWAVIHYVRALQRARNPRPEDLNR